MSFYRGDTCEITGSRTRTLPALYKDLYWSQSPDLLFSSKGNHNSDFSDHGLVLPVFNSTWIETEYIFFYAWIFSDNIMLWHSSMSLNTAVVCSLLLLCNTPWYDCPTIYLSNLLFKKNKNRRFLFFNLHCAWIVACGIFSCGRSFICDMWDPVLWSGIKSRPPLHWGRGILATVPAKGSEVKSLSRVRLFATPWTVAYQDPPCMGFSRQEYWNGLSCPPPGDLPNPWKSFASPALAGRFFTASVTWEAPTQKYS